MGSLPRNIRMQPQRNAKPAGDIIGRQPDFDEMGCALVDHDEALRLKDNGWAELNAKNELVDFHKTPLADLYKRQEPRAANGEVMVKGLPASLKAAADRALASGDNRALLASKDDLTRYGADVSALELIKAAHRAPQKMGLIR